MYLFQIYRPYKAQRQIAAPDENRGKLSAFGAIIKNRPKNVMGY